MSGRTTTGPRQWLTRARLWAALAAILLILALAAPTAVNTARQLCAEPLDVSGTRQLPSLLSAIKDRDEISYPAHVVLGTLLQDRGCDASAVALQWVKAASHARGESEVERTAQGLRAAVSSSLQPVKVEREICRKVGAGPLRAELRESLVRAGLACVGGE